MNLKERIETYQQASDHKLLGRVPLIICINGRNYSKQTELLDKPYCPKFADAILSTMLRVCEEIDGAFFAYQFNDEIMVIARNDQSLETATWYKNNLQKICSATASIATLHFSQMASATELNMMTPTFTSNVFVVPNITDAINTVIFKQQYNFFLSIQFACFYELLNKYDRNTIISMLAGLSVDEKISLLQQECNIDFNNYPMAFRRGSACYKSPTLIDGNIKNKWMINAKLPIFTKEQKFLNNLFKDGVDIFRNENFK